MVAMVPQDECLESVPMAEAINKSKEG